MRCVILAAGRFDDSLRAEIARQREPRLDVFQLARELDAKVIDFQDVDRSTDPLVKFVARTAGNSAAVALLGFRERAHCNAFFTTGEDIGLPRSVLLKPSPARSSHTMIVHTLFPKKKRAFFKIGRVSKAFDRILLYSTSEERLAIDELGVPADRVQRIYYHADEQFFRPDARPTEPDLICAAGQLLRDYDCLLDAIDGLPVRVQIAAGSPWIERPLQPKRALPANVTWGRMNRYELREMYARSAIAVVPILQNHYQTGIATILEMMAMGKCVIATRTHGQTDTIVDGDTGVYVPPSEPRALRAAIQRVLADPEAASRMGQAARKFIEENAGLDLFVDKLTQAVAKGHAVRFGSESESA